MKTAIKIICMLALLLTMTGCIVYGEGRTYGYVTTIEESYFWSNVWIRAELESSQTDCYVLEHGNTNLAEELRKTILNKQRIELKYKRHIVTIGCSNDEAVGYEVV